MPMNNPRNMFLKEAIVLRWERWRSAKDGELACGHQLTITRIVRTAKVVCKRSFPMR